MDGIEDRSDSKHCTGRKCDDECSIEEFTCSLYISRALERQVQGPQTSADNCLSRPRLEQAIQASEPVDSWQVSTTSCALIAAFADESDADKLLQTADLARILDGPVQVARFSAKDCRYRQTVLLRDVPRAIPIQDLSSALTKQGIKTGKIERVRQSVRVEILDANQYELLLERGLDFFGAVRFGAVPERYWREGFPSTTSSSAGLASCNYIESSNAQQNDGVLQCYRCQGFWHVAANCRHLQRCVRCGEPHSVEFCPRPRNNPVCCHCSGPHHAGYKQCPVRLQLVNATPVSVMLSTICTPAKTVKP